MNAGDRRKPQALRSCLRGHARHVYSTCKLSWWRTDKTRSNPGTSLCFTPQSRPCRGIPTGARNAESSVRLEQAQWGFLSTQGTTSSLAVSQPITAPAPPNASSFPPTRRVLHPPSPPLQTSSPSSCKTKRNNVKHAPPNPRAAFSAFVTPPKANKSHRPHAPLPRLHFTARNRLGRRDTNTPGSYTPPQPRQHGRSTTLGA